MFCTLAPVLTDFFLYSFFNFHVMPLHKLLTATVACCCYNNNTQRNTLMHFILRPFKNASISKCSLLRPERLGFKMSLPILENSAGHFRKPVRKFANPQIADSRFWFVDLRTDFLPQTFAVKKVKSTANQQHHWDRFCNFQKNTFLRFYVSTDLGGCTSEVQYSLTKFLCYGTIISQRCCYFLSKMS